MQHLYSQDDLLLETNNRVQLTGSVMMEPVFSQENAGFFEFSISVGRLSGMADVVPVMAPAELVQNMDLCEGSIVAVQGQFRSHNKIVGERSKLLLSVFATEIFKICELSANPNLIDLVGFVCKPPIYRTTPFNREIADVLVAVNRSFNKSDYIPIIAWGKNARFAKNLAVGDKVAISGRVQSREYQKRLEDDTVETRIAYEVSANTLGKVE